MKISDRILSVVPILVILLIANTAISEPLTCKILQGKPNKVTFISKAPLETIKGVTDQISGTLNFDPADLSSATAMFEVQMATLDTDNKMRNGHMRDNHLHTDEYPSSKFVLGEIIEQGALVSGETAEFKIKGEFTLHGVTKTIEPSISARWDKAKMELQVTAKFDVLLADYEIPRPKFLVMKLDERQAVEVKFTAKAESQTGGE